MPAWSNVLLDESGKLTKSDYIVAHGGRGSSKTWTIAQLLILQMLQRKLRIICVRERMNSTENSVKPALEDRIRSLGLSNIFDIKTTKILCPATDSKVLFRGMSKTTEDSVYGWEGVDIVWIDEGQHIQRDSLNILYPTVRKEGAQIIIVLNPRFRTDAISEDFLLANSPRTENAIVCKVNWRQNPWFTARLERERQATLRSDPARYAHIWEGEFDDSIGARHVLPWALLQKCVDAWPRRFEHGRYFLGLDVADSIAGGDRNALVIRKGPCIMENSAWHSAKQNQTAARADRKAQELNAAMLYYDRSAVGAGIKTWLNTIYPRGKIGYGVTGVSFGEKVMGGKNTYSTGVKNADFFSRRNAQMAWALRLRAQTTEMFLEGHKVAKEKCLFINPKMPNLNEFLTHLTQPLYREDSSGRIVIDKAPDNSKSPDLYDATALAFARDSFYGLRIN